MHIHYIQSFRKCVHAKRAARFQPIEFRTGTSSYAGFGQFVPLPLIGTSGIMSDLSAYFHPSRLFTHQTLLVPPLADWQPRPPLHPASQSLVPHQNLYLLHQRSYLISSHSRSAQRGFTGRLVRASDGVRMDYRPSCQACPTWTYPSSDDLSGPFCRLQTCFYVPLPVYPAQACSRCIVSFVSRDSESFQLRIVFLPCLVHSLEEGLHTLPSHCAYTHRLTVSYVS